MVRPIQSDGPNRRRRQVSAAHSSKRNNTQPLPAQNGDGGNNITSSETKERHDRIGVVRRCALSDSRDDLRLAVAYTRLR